MQSRHKVLCFLSLLSVITYLDRACISVAGPRIQEELGISPGAWGWVVGAFAIAYGAFEIPSGYLGDRFGPRMVLTRIVLWWSAFTALTGAVSSYNALLATRFLFGVGEAGAYPNASAAITRWFPVSERARTFGVVWMFSQAGAALSPLLVVPLQMRYGWRASFYVFAVLGVAWSIAWYRWFRDDPPGIVAVKRVTPASRPSLPWRTALRSSNLRAVWLVALAYCYAMYFFIAWLHTYLVKGRGFHERELWLSAAPFVLGALANACGGLACDALASRFGLKAGRRLAGAASLTVAAFSILAGMLSAGHYATVAFLSVGYAAICFQQPAVWAVCLDIGGDYAGAVSGSMNTAAQLGSFILSVSYGYMVGISGSYDTALVPVAAMLLVGAVFWLKIDATKKCC
ncbi:MAG: MFS transporter [Acidobacteria bacterium]|nr:MFS transporter [Acidobacteriota bacterium]